MLHFERVINMAGTVTIRLNDIEEDILDKASLIHGLGKSSLVKQLAFERLEDEYDLKVFEKYEKKKAKGKLKTRPIEELWAELGL